MQGVKVYFFLLSTLLRTMYRAYSFYVILTLELLVRVWFDRCRVVYGGFVSAVNVYTDLEGVKTNDRSQDPAPEDHSSKLGFR